MLVGIVAHTADDILKCFDESDILVLIRKRKGIFYEKETIFIGYMPGVFVRI